MSSFPAPHPVAATRDAIRVRRGAKAAVTSASGVLLVKERHADGREFWTLPGGGVKRGEGLAETLGRELVEELRCEPVVGGPIGSFWYAHLSSPAISRYTVFSCAVTGAVRPVRGEGILDVTWADPARLPTGTLPQVRHLLAARNVAGL